MKKTFCFFAVFLLLFFGNGVFVRASSVDEMLPLVRDTVDFDMLESAVPDAVREVFSVSDGQNSPGISGIFRILFFAVGDVFSPWKRTLFVGIGLILLFRLICSLSPNSADAEGLCFLVAVVGGIASFSAMEGMFLSLRETSEAISSFLTASLPVSVSLRILSGNPSGAAELSAAVPFLLQWIAFLIPAVFQPLCLFCFAASLTGFRRTAFTLRPLVSTVRKWAVRGVEFFSLVCVGILSVLRVSSGASDRLRSAAKLALTDLIPVAGGFLSDGIQTAVDCAGSLCSQAGILSVLTVCALSVSPCVSAVLAQGVCGIFSSVSQSVGLDLLGDLFSQWQDVFAVMTSFTLCSSLVLCASLLMLTGG